MSRGRGGRAKPTRVYSVIEAATAALAISVEQNAAVGASVSTVLRNAAGAKGFLGTPVVVDITGAAASKVSASVLFDPVASVWRGVVTVVDTSGAVGVTQATVRWRDSTNGDGVTYATAVLDLTRTAATGTPILRFASHQEFWNFTVGGAEPLTTFVATQNIGGGNLGALSFGAISYPLGGPAGWASFVPVPGGFEIRADCNPTLGAQGTFTERCTGTDATSGTTDTIDITVNVAAAPPTPAVVVTPGSHPAIATQGQAPAAKAFTVSNGTGAFALLGQVSVAIIGGATWLSPVLNGQTVTVTFAVFNNAPSPTPAIVRVTTEFGGTFDISISGTMQPVGTGYPPPANVLPDYLTYSTVSGTSSGEPYALDPLGAFS